MADGKIQMQRGDVTLVELKPDLCHDCEVRPATHTLEVDFRAVGVATEVMGHYCEQCGSERLASIRETLPEDTDDGTVTP